MASEETKPDSNDVLIEVKDLKKYFPIRRGVFSRVVGHVKAVDGISFKIRRGKTLGLVGESGCGKTTAGRTILRLLEPTEGDVLYEGKSILPLRGQALRAMRRNMQIIFQDPYGSLNPRMTIGSIVGEPIAIHHVPRAKREERVRELLEKVGLSRNHINRYPHEFSGGQRQRIGIARAIALNPSFIVCDEAVSALDVSIQAQIVNLLEELQEEFGLSYLFIAHDLSVVKHVSDEVVVMYLGKLVEHAPSDDLYTKPLHPYTQALLSAVPVPDPKSGRKRIVLEGDVPSPSSPPSGCPFHTRCPYPRLHPDAMERCKNEAPEVSSPTEGHSVVCHFYKIILENGGIRKVHSGAESLQP
ncbi:MAG: dipeptide ABC transporter ATP-binding protein [Planctomycetes bacterium]|nr:dipeptide ABC transporter ATP-binding protein [Planctomycetota bacterium]